MGLCEWGKEAGLMLSWREPTEGPPPALGVPGAALSWEDSSGRLCLLR